MIPNTLSASSLHVAELCMSRWRAEYLERGRGESNDAAALGSAVHGALEYYVKATQMGENRQTESLSLLERFYEMSFMTEFSTADASGPEFDDGWQMLKKWFMRTTFEGVEVLSCEVKEFFPVKFPNGAEVPFNFIWDRFDKTGDNEYKVVDYKSIRWAIRADDLGIKIQARIYALAVQIKYPDAQKIWVEFDQLRHDAVGMVFTREDNIATWKFLKAAVQRIWEFEYDPDDEPETLNSECRWCVRKVSCNAVSKNAAVGGLHSLLSLEDAIERRALMDFQQSAAKSALDELDKWILAEAQQLDSLEFMTTNFQANIGVRSTRAVDGERAENILGPDLFKKYGSTSITMGDVDRLLKGDEITNTQKKQLEGIIYQKIGEPKVKTKKVSPFDKE